MTLRKYLVITVAVAVSCVLVLAGCGGEEASSDTSSPVPAESVTSAEGATSTTRVTPTTEADALEAYKVKMKEWQGEHDTRIKEGAEAMSAIADPFTATEDDIKAMSQFADAIRAAANGLQDIEPPADLSSAHSEYRSTLETMAQGLGDLTQAIKDQDLSGLMEALSALEAGTESGTSARDTLEGALGFSLVGGDIGEGTTPPEEDTSKSGEPGTRENPIPLGEEAQVGPWKVTVVGATLDATALVLDHNEFNEAPAAGEQYVLIEIEATRTAEEAAAFWVDMSYVFVGAGGNTFEAAFADVPDAISDMGEAYKGASVTGNLVFQVPSEQVAGGTLRLEESFSFEDSEVFFAIE